MSIANLRILRLTLGTALCLWFSQVVGWKLSYIAPVFTMFLLALPLPAMGLRAGIRFVLVFLVALLAGLLLLPTLLHQRAVGLSLLSLALFGSFYFTARGGSAALGAFLTVGLSLTTAVGSVSIDGLLDLIKGLVIGAVTGILFVWLAHAVLPDASANREAGGPRPTPPPKPDVAMAGARALRSLLIVFPVLIWFLLSSDSASYTAVMIKVASMGQQVTNDRTNKAAKSLLASTVIGGVAAIIGWQVLRIWPSLLIYTLLVALAGLVMGRRIFSGTGMRPSGGTWSYGYLTMIVVLAPAVLDGQGGGSADAAFWSRLIMFMGATLYSVIAVFVFDAFNPSLHNDRTRRAGSESQPDGPG